MKILRGKSSNPDQPFDNPFPVKGWLFWEWRGGDRIQPWFGNWFTPPYFKYVQRDYIDTPRKLYVSWKIPFLNWQGYFGAKAFGVDAEAYKNWLPPEEVYSGSQALMMYSIRPFASIT